MIIKACGASHKGNLRGHNEDNIYVDGSYRNDLSMDNVFITGKREAGPHTFAVFDGLGGESSGERASYIGAACMAEAEKNGSIKEPELFISAIHHVIRKEADRIGAHNMGTTVAAVHIEDNIGTVFNVGDSRVYLYRGHDVYQLSRDHSVVQSMIDYGLMKEADRNTSRHAGELTQYLGMTSEEEIEPSAACRQVHLISGDMLILCSDGLTGEIDKDEICEVVEEFKELGMDKLALALIKRAVDKIGRDNVSVIAASVE
jgi:protein phosphatase